MWLFDATEQAYKNGYEAGKKSAVVHGQWIEKSYDEDDWFFKLYHCSECDTPNAHKRNFCSYCGAKMDGDGNG